MSASDNEKKLRAQIAANESWAATEDRTERTAPARDAFKAQFLERAGGDPVRAEHLRKAHFQRLALKSAKSRRLAKELLATALEAEAELSAKTGGVS